jgi:hypothetical protein
MENSKTYLLSSIVNHKKEFNSLGEFPAKNFDDIAEVMERFAIETVIDVIKRINNGESVDIGGQTISLKRNLLKFSQSRESKF